MSIIAARVWVTNTHPYKHRMLDQRKICQFWHLATKTQRSRMTSRSAEKKTIATNRLTWNVISNANKMQVDITNVNNMFVCAIRCIALSIIFVVYSIPTVKFNNFQGRYVYFHIRQCWTLFYFMYSFARLYVFQMNSVRQCK